MKGDIVSQGWERISIDSDLKQKLETFFLDLCSYALIIVCLLYTSPSPRD